MKAKPKSAAKVQPRKIPYIPLEERKLTKRQLNTATCLCNYSPFFRLTIGDLTIDQLRVLVYEHIEMVKQMEKQLYKAHSAIDNIDCLLS